MIRITGAETAACFAAAVLFGGSAVAKEFKPAPNATHTVDLDTADGNFSVWRVNGLTDINAARGSLSIPRLGRDSKWAASFQVKVGDAQESINLRFMAAKGKGPILVALTRFERGKEVESEFFLTTVEVGEKIELEMDWTPTGEVTALIRSKATREIGDFERHSLTLKSVPTRFEVIASTGELAIDPLVLGKAS